METFTKNIEQKNTPLKNPFPKSLTAGLLTLLAACATPQKNTETPQDLPALECDDYSCHPEFTFRARKVEAIQTPFQILNTFKQDHDFPNAYAELHLTEANCRGRCDFEVADTLKKIIKFHNQNVNTNCNRLPQTDADLYPSEQDIKNSIQKADKIRNNPQKREYLAGYPVVAYSICDNYGQYQRIQSTVGLPQEFLKPVSNYEHYSYYHNLGQSALYSREMKINQ